MLNGKEKILKSIMLKSISKHTGDETEDEASDNNHNSNLQTHIIDILCCLTSPDDMNCYRKLIKCA